MSRTLSRRAILGSFAGAACAPSLAAQQLAGEPPGRIAPLAEIVNVFELQEMARRKLPESVYATIAGSNRAALERITFRPRLMVNVTKLDLSLDLLGTKLFAPVLLGPVWRQESFHPEAEIATARGAAASKSLIIVSSRASKPLPQIIEAAGESPVWFQAYPEVEPQATVTACQAAVKLGCKAICITVGTPREASTNPKITLETIDRIKQSVTAPLLVKGILNADEGAAVASKGVQAIVISNHGAPAGSGLVDPMEMLPAIVKATGKVPILVDGSFRRGTDVLKALALGAKAVLVARPAMWGLAAYGAEGVQAAMEMLQTELARAMAMCGKPILSAIDAGLVKIHRR